MVDKKGAKHEAGPDDIMSAAELKQILLAAKRGNDIGCAIAMTKDKDGIILADKHHKPKKLMAEMRKKAASLGLELENTSLRFGRAMVDAEKDSSLLSIKVNKDAPAALRPKLLAHIKKAGFSKLEIIIDAALESESADDHEDAG